MVIQDSEKVLQKQKGLVEKIGKGKKRLDEQNSTRQRLRDLHLTGTQSFRSIGCGNDELTPANSICKGNVIISPLK